MKNPLVASIVAACMTTCLLLVTALNFGLLVLLRGEVSRGESLSYLDEDGTLLAPGDLDQVVWLSGVAWVAVALALACCIVVGVTAVRRGRAVSPVLAAIPAVLVLLSLAVPLTTAHRLGTMTWFFTLVALAATVMQALALTRDTTGDAASEAASSASPSPSDARA